MEKELEKKLEEYKAKFDATGAGELLCLLSQKDREILALKRLINTLQHECQARMDLLLESDKDYVERGRDLERLKKLWMEGVARQVVERQQREEEKFELNQLRDEIQRSQGRILQRPFIPVSSNLVGTGGRAPGERYVMEKEIYLEEGDLVTRIVGPKEEGPILKEGLTSG